VNSSRQKAYRQPSLKGGGFEPLKIYHICDCCDTIYKVTETTAYGNEYTDLTENAAGDIINNEPENGNSFAAGLCDECRDEMYGPVGEIVQPYRLH